MTKPEKAEVLIHRVGILKPQASWSQLEAHGGDPFVMTSGPHPFIESQQVISHLC